MQRSEAQSIGLESLPTPSLILDRQKLLRNIARLRSRVAESPIVLRPHLKTIKSYDAAVLALESDAGPATISTLAEAEYFGGHGVTDLLYSVCIAPQKLERVTKLRRQGIDLIVVLDSMDAAQKVSHHAGMAKDAIPVLVEINVDGHRSGLKVDQEVELIAIAKILQQGGCDVRGVMAHAGGSYALSGPAALAAASERERASAVYMSDVLKSAGMNAPVVSVGSTPTAFGSASFAGVTEIRAGVYMFFDLVQTGIGVCTIDDIAISVLATVIGHSTSNDWIFVDTGWTAMSLDRGTKTQAIDQYFGLVCDIEGQPIEDLILLRVNQEHGIVSVRPGSARKIPKMNVGDRIRILPNHACATSAQHDTYNVVGPDNNIVQTWARFRGW